MKTRIFLGSMSLLLLMSCNINIPIEVTQKPKDIVYGEFTDSRDGNVYKTIQIGNQTWMAENLRYMPEVYPIDNAYRGKSRYYVYNYNGNDVKEARLYKVYDANIGKYSNESTWYTFGTLYNNTAAQSAAPAGWRLPTKADFQELFDYLKAKYGGDRQIYAAALLSQESYNMNWNRDGGKSWKQYPWFGATGFDAMPAGYVSVGGGSYSSDIGSDTYYWISDTEYSSVCYFRMSGNLVGGYNLYFNSHRNEDRDWYGYSVRCIKK